MLKVYDNLMSEDYQITQPKNNYTNSLVNAIFGSGKKSC